MSGVDRAHYVLDKLDAYEDAPQLRVTIALWSIVLNRSLYVVV